MKPYLLDNLLSSSGKGAAGPGEEMIIGQDKKERQELICEVFANLVKITQVDYMQVVLKNFLINDYDHQLSYSVCNMIHVLRQMITNCFNTSKDSEQPTVDYYNLTNPIYIELTEQVLKQYISSFDEAQSSSQMEDSESSLCS